MTIIHLLFLLFFQSSDRNTVQEIHILNKKDFIEINLNSYKDQDINLYLGSIDLEDEYFDKIIKLSEQNNIRELSLNETKIDDEELEQFFFSLTKLKLLKLNLMTLKERYQFKSDLKTLKSINISRSTLSNTFLNLLLSSPSLKTLKLNSFQMDNNIFRSLRHIPFEQIDELEISNSNFTTNKLITLIPQELESQIKVLKFNNNAKLENLLELEDDELSLYSSYKDKNKIINWKSPFFSNLEKLEIKSKSKSIKYVMNIMENSFFAKLKHFKGIEYDYNPIKKNREKMEKIFNAASKSIVSSYNFKSIKLLNIFFKSNQSKIVEHIEFEGKDFTIELVEFIINEKFIPNLKKITLNRIMANQTELRELIQKVKSIDFNIIKEIDKNEVNMWPRLRVK